MHNQEGSEQLVAPPAPASLSSSPASSFATSSFPLLNGVEVTGRPVDGGAEPVPLQRVIDVPLSVTLRFGQRQLTLRELLDLSTGALVELDRQVEEPVDLMLGDRLIARGEVVIVDGNYGMRVTEVVENHRSHLQRAAALLA